MNWARVFDLPVLFVCEDNAFAATTRTEAMTGGPGPAARAEALGIPSHAADGNDVDRMAEVTAELRGRILGGGPQFLWAKTWRLTGHTAVDKAAYRDAGEVEERWKDDPIARAAETLRAHGVGEETLTVHREAAVEEMRAAYEEAKAAPWPETASPLCGRAGYRRPARGGVPMVTTTYMEAGRRALAEEMRRDPTVWALGEDLGRGAGGHAAGGGDALCRFRPLRCGRAGELGRIDIHDSLGRDYAIHGAPPDFRLEMGAGEAL